MYFKRLEMHGFKSFAEPVVIEFHEGITCIVGPNGSGKSNISDAIRWVLGEQSPKMLRGGKMEEVIFSGTASRKSRGMAEVTLVIDNTAGILPIDYNEVAITRRMYRTGESEYLINQNPCRLRDIRELIMDTGIGVEGYSIIGQGKIVDIVSNKPESRREIFEEAAGVVMYKSRKAEAEKKLESTSANLERVNDIIGEIEGRIDTLREDSQKAREYLTLKERYQDLEINITLKNIEKLDLTNASLKEEMEDLLTAAEKLQKEKKEVDGELSKNRQRNDDLEQLGNEAKDKLLEKVEEINHLSNQSQLDAERLNTIDRDCRRLEEEAALLEQKFARESEEQANLLKEKDELSCQLAEAEKALAEKIEAYNAQVMQTAALAEAVDEGKEQMFRMQSQISAKRSEARSVDSYKESLSNRKSQLLQEEKDLEENIRVYAENLKQAKEEKKTLAGQAAALSEEIEDIRLQEKALTEENRRLSKKREDLHIQNGQFAARKKTIEEMEHNYEGYQGAVRYIMRNSFHGIRGVIADLMKVPAGLEAAIETALGGAMQNIVCEKDEDAKNAIIHLKKNKGGRATFLPMESLKSPKIQNYDFLKAEEGFRGLGVDCIEFEMQYEPVFRYLLGRVAVVDTMDHAVAMSKKDRTGLRFVTLDGEIINASGAITGGKYKNATANLLERKREILRLEEKISDLREEGREIEAALEKGIKEAQGLLEKIKEKEEACRQIQLREMNLDDRISNLLTGQKEADSSQEKRKKELSSIDREVAETGSMAEALRKEAETGEAELEDLRLKIEKNMEAYTSQKAVSEKVSEEITQLRIARNQQAAKMDSCNQLLARTEETAADLKLQITYKKEECDKLKEEKEQILSGSEDGSRLAETKKREKQELEDYISQVKEERNLLNEKIRRFSETQLQLAEKINGFQDQKYQMEIKLTKNQTQLDTFKEKLWDEFEISYMQALDMRKEDFAMSAAMRESREIRGRLREMGDINVGAIKEYEQVSKRYEFLTEQRTDILTAMTELKSIIEDMDRTIRERFKENFDQVVIYFEEIFSQLFGGGHAELRLDDEENPLESGIEIIAQPPGKKLQNINLMSGGEKTMTAIALMFAVLKTKPTPFCILDEVEAALDDANIDRFASYLRNFHSIQFAIITHQKATMEYADVLYGVTMPEQGISQVISLRLGDDFEL